MLAASVLVRISPLGERVDLAVSDTHTVVELESPDRKRKGVVRVRR